MRVFFDSSALAKRCVLESGSQNVAQICQQATSLGISIILQVTLNAIGVNRMSNQHIHIGVEDAQQGFERFTDAWRKAQSGAVDEAEVHLHFEDFSMLTAVLTPKRLELLKTVRQQGPFSVRALSKVLARDYKNVYVDAASIDQASA